MFETIVGIFVCAGNFLIFFIIARQIRRVPSVQHNGETLRPISRAKVWSNERFYVGGNEIFRYNGNALVSSHPIASITRVEKQPEHQPRLCVGHPHPSQRQILHFQLSP